MLALVICNHDLLKCTNQQMGSYSTSNTSFLISSQGEATSSLPKLLGGVPVLVAVNEIALTVDSKKLPPNMGSAMDKPMIGFPQMGLVG